MPREQEYNILQMNTAGRNHGRRWRVARVVDTASVENDDTTREVLTVWEQTFDTPITSLVATRRAYPELQKWLTEHLRLGGVPHVEIAYVLQTEDFFGRWATTRRRDHLMRAIIREQMARHRLTQST